MCDEESSDFSFTVSEKLELVIDSKQFNGDAEIKYISGHNEIFKVWSL